MTQQFQPDYGSDLSCTTDLDPNCRVVTGTEMMVEACLRRLMCRKGSLLSDPLYGIDLRDFLNSRIDAAALARIPAVIQGELARDERIFSTAVTTTFRNNTLTVVIKADGATGPFALTLLVSGVTIQLLSPV